MEDCWILVSLHTNSVVYDDWDGVMALYIRLHEGDKQLAGAMYELMYPCLQGTAPDSAAFCSFELEWFASGVLLRSAMPAAMVEPFFMSIPAEAELLQTSIYPGSLAGDFNPDFQGFSCRRWQIAVTKFNSILNYYTEPQGKKAGKLRL